MFKPNTLFYTDGYKVGHKRMLAPGTTKLYGTYIPRSLKHAPKGVKKIVSFGHQLVWKWLNDEFEENFFKQPLENAAKFGKDMSLYLGMDYNADHFKELYFVGYLPMRVKGLPEGIETDANIPHMTFINTRDGFGWLTLYLETIVSNLAWKTSTAATIALQYRRNATEWVMKTDPSTSWLIPFMCHDFSARGLSGPYDMLAVGLGHASSFRGSDSIICIPGARYFYNEPEDQVCINSVNASEHSVSTTKIFTVGEKQMLSDWMVEFPKGILSVVSDTFDLWQLITKYLPELKEEILKRDGKLVIRPDSGDPVEILCGTGREFDTFYMKDIKEDLIIVNNGHALNNAVYHNGDGKSYKWIEIIGTSSIKAVRIDVEPSRKGVIELLWDIFGGSVNEQGYKVLDPHIGAIYGDSITLDRQVEIYERLAAKGFASTNIVLGVGSFTYQMNTRDTLGWAVKGAWFVADGKEYDIYKDPVTDDGTKRSKKGMVAVFERMDGTIWCKDQCSKFEETQGLLQVIFEDGKFFNQTTLQEVRDRIKV